MSGVRARGSPAATAAAAILLAGGLAAQALLQGPLGRENRVRASRRLDAAPASLPFRLAAGGVKEAAADALWLTMLPRLSRSWPDPQRKALWIENGVSVLVDASPRSLLPVIYGAYFLERIEQRHPGIERLVRRAMETRTLGPFRSRDTPHADSWELNDLLGMNLYLHGTEEEKDRGLEYLKRAALHPDCPTIDVSLVARLERDRGNDLVGTRLWIHRAETTDNPDWKAHYLGEADRERLRVLRKWAEAFEARTGRWPERMEEVVGEAPEAAALSLRGNPAFAAWFRGEVVLHPRTRDLEIPRVTSGEVEAGRRRIRSLLDRYEAEFGRPPAAFEELQGSLLRPLPRPPLLGTKWALDGEGGVTVEGDTEDPRLRR